MRFGVLGTLEVVDGERRLDLGAPRERALFALLLLHANQVVPVDRIVEDLWSGAPPPTVTKIVQVYVSHLRRALGADRERLESRGPGYVLRVGPDDLDLFRFEQLVERAMGEEPAARTETLREALALWRGPALADFAYDSFVQTEAARLEELRLLALERRVEADLELGSGPELVPELEALVAAHPLRERFRAQLMLALYRAGRQADALAVFREGRTLLAEELGLEPGAELRALEAAILRQDPELAPRAVSRPRRSIVAIPERPAAWTAVLPLAGALATGATERQLVLAEMASASEVARRTEALEKRRRALGEHGVAVRVAAFSSNSPALDAVRLASQQEADLLLLSAVGDPFAGPFAGALHEATCDVGVVIEDGGPLTDGPIVVPFGAFEHDWAALELGAWVASALGRQLQLIGATDPQPGGTDASRLLADASLVVQHTAGIVAQPLLGARGPEGIRTLAAGAGLLVVGLSERWRVERLGETRWTLVADPPAPLVLVRRGLRPGGIAPAATLTRFTWSIQGSRMES